MKVARLEESHAFAPAQVPEQEEIHSFLFQNGFVAVAPALQIGDKLIFALVERNSQDGGFPTAPDVKERLEQLLATDLLDRLLHHCNVVNIDGRSFRLRNIEQRIPAKE